MSAKLSVNINKWATLRNARGHNNPDILQAAKDIQLFGAEGITVHPRPDERHIKYADARNLKNVVYTEYNVEGYPDKKFMDLVCDICPTQVTLVPDAPNVLTSNNGWNTITHFDFLKEIVSELKLKNIRVSLFLNPEIKFVENVNKIGADRIELYTEMYAKNYHINKEDAIIKYAETSLVASKNELGINAGHDLDLHNLQFFAARIPQLLEVSIGHALICDAIYFGLQNVVQMYKEKLKIDEN